MKYYLSKGLLPVGLCFAVCFNGLLPATLAQNLPARIDIVTVEGEGVINNIRQRVTHGPVVRVEDDDHRPVAGAVVVFALPVSGTTGEFSNGSKTLTMLTDKDGQAAAQGLKTNDIPGKLQILVTASYHGLRARTTVSQFVEAAPGAKAPVSEVHSSKSGGKWKWVVLGIVAGGGAGAGLYFGRHTTANSSPISISTGSVIFGSPR